MQAGARGEAPRVAQELGVTKIFVPSLVSSQPLVSQEYVSQERCITKTLYHKNFVSL